MHIKKLSGLSTENAEQRADIQEFTTKKPPNWSPRMKRKLDPASAKNSTSISEKLYNNESSKAADASVP